MAYLIHATSPNKEFVVLSEATTEAQAIEDWSKPGFSLHLYQLEGLDEWPITVPTERALEQE